MPPAKVRRALNACQMIDQSDFRRVIGHFATGVAVVTTRQPDGRPCGLTVSAVSSVSLDPTLILVCVERRADSHSCIRSAGYFAVNILPERGGEALARRFASSVLENKFVDVQHRSECTGAPVLADALAWMDCAVTEILDGGDHTIFLGEPVAADAGEGAPLLYYRSTYGSLAT